MEGVFDPEGIFAYGTGVSAPFHSERISRGTRPPIRMSEHTNVRTLGATKALHKKTIPNVIPEQTVRDEEYSSIDTLSSVTSVPQYLARLIDHQDEQDCYQPEQELFNLDSINFDF